MTDAPAPHLEVAPGDVGRYVFLPGDPARAELIAQRFDEPRLVASNREFVTWSGVLDDELVSVTSTGIGGPSAAIALEELVAVGADTFVRVGTSGAMQPDIEGGTIGVIHGAIRDEGTTVHYLPVEFPAVAHPDVTAALTESARLTGRPVRVGVAQSKDSYYGQHDPDRMPVGPRLRERWAAWVGGGAICSEMEAAALYVVAAVLGVRVGAVVAVHPLAEGRPAQAAAAPDLEPLLDAAIGGMSTLIAADRRSGDT